MKGIAGIAGIAAAIALGAVAVGHADEYFHDRPRTPKVPRDEPKPTKASGRDAKRKKRGKHLFRV